jgi:hypothetical protein
MRHYHSFGPGLVAVFLIGLGCSSNGTSPGSGTGGSKATGSGGSGGGSGSGGTSGGTGGSDGTGGASGTGGDSSGGTGGATAPADAADTASGTGGSTPPTDAPKMDMGVDQPASTTPSFFVTSKGPGMGGNLGGLAGADAFCKQLAMAASADLGAKTWHAYLSTATVNARDRIGTGPWRNTAGKIIANNLTELHDQLAANAMLNATWPPGSTTIALDEKGAEVPSNPLVHDILTGSNTDGTVMVNQTCSDWTSSSMTGTAVVGHSNRAGGGRPPSWNNAHTVGCAEPTAGMDFQMGTVSSGGGRGSIYCFAVP